MGQTGWKSLISLTEMVLWTGSSQFTSEFI